MTPAPNVLGQELRAGSSAYVKRRRGIVSLTLLSCAALGVTALYQIGILKRLPGPRSSKFNAEKVNGSRQAYSMLSIPDAFLGLASYSVTASLAAMGGEERWRTTPWMTLGMGAKLLCDALMASKLTADEIRKFNCFSLWSLLIAACTFAALPLAAPEVAAAVKRIAAR